MNSKGMGKSWIFAAAFLLASAGLAAAAENAPATAAEQATPAAGAASGTVVTAPQVGPGVDAEGYEPPPEGFEPEIDPVQKGPTPYYVPAVPQLLEHIDADWGTNFWRR